MKSTILVTGARGFVGRTLCAHLLAAGWNVRGTILPSQDPSDLISGVQPVVIQSICDDTDWGEALIGVSVVVHLAARVHIMRETASDPLKEFRLVNTDGSVRLATEAASAGITRLIFLSTVGVNGNCSGKESYSEEDRVRPHNAYSISKSEAETLLSGISTKLGIELVIIRAPLVYGPGSPGNFLKLLAAVHKGIPLPFAWVKNQRSLIYVNNLADVLAICVTHPSAAGEIFLVSDNENISTPELIRVLAHMLDVPVRLFPVPTLLLRVAGSLVGKTAAITQLVGSLTIDSSKVKILLGWIPPYTMEEGLRNTTDWYTRHSSVNSVV